MSVRGRVTRSVRTLVVLLLVACTLPVAPAPARAASPSPAPSPSPTFCPCTVELTGHWAVPGTSGFDIRQSGTWIDGTSVAGVSFSGTLASRTVTFRFWSGSSFAKAAPEDRGTGSFLVDPSGDLLFVSWVNEKPSTTSLDPVFVASRVRTIIAQPSGQPSADPAQPWNSWFTPSHIAEAQWLSSVTGTPLETVIEYLILLSVPPLIDLFRDLELSSLMLYQWRDWDRNNGIKPRDP